MKTLPSPIAFEWDKGNIEKSYVKHGITNKEAEEVFFNKPLKIFQDAKHSQEEKRFLAYGATNQKRGLTIVFTIRKQKIRVVSARNQNKKERRIYEKE